MQENMFGKYLPEFKKNVFYDDYPIFCYMCIKPNCNKVIFEK